MRSGVPVAALRASFCANSSSISSSSTPRFVTASACRTSSVIGKTGLELGSVLIGARKNVAKTGIFP